MGAFLPVMDRELKPPFPPGAAEIRPFLLPLRGDFPKAFEDVQHLLI